MSKKTTISKNIKKYRAKLGISQDKLSKMANVTYDGVFDSRAQRVVAQKYKKIAGIKKSIDQELDKAINAQVSF